MELLDVIHQWHHLLQAVPLRRPVLHGRGAEQLVVVELAHTEVELLAQALDLGDQRVHMLLLGKASQKVIPLLRAVGHGAGPGQLVLFELPAGHLKPLVQALDLALEGYHSLQLVSLLCEVLLGVGGLQFLVGEDALRDVQLLAQTLDLSDQRIQVFPLLTGGVGIVDVWWCSYFIYIILLNL